MATLDLAQGFGHHESAARWRCRLWTPQGPAVDI